MFGTLYCVPVETFRAQRRIRVRLVCMWWQHGGFNNNMRVPQEKHECVRLVCMCASHSSDGCITMIEVGYAADVRNMYGSGAEVRSKTVSLQQTRQQKQQ